MRDEWGVFGVLWITDETGLTSGCFMWLFFFRQKQAVLCTQHLRALRGPPRGRRARLQRGAGSVERPMSGAGEALAPGPQRGAEAGGGRLGAPAQGECLLASGKPLCHCCILKFVHT